MKQSSAMGDERVERVARAICKARGGNPEECLSGYSWAAGELGRTEGGSVCHKRNWERFIPDAKAALEASGLTGGWRDIATAPEDGSTFWALDRLDGQPWHYECIWNGAYFYHGFGDAWPEANPTHWQPLPQTPEVSR